ncbi:hypothetical protein [Paenibacillus sp. FSL H7-0716]
MIILNGMLQLLQILQAYTSQTGMSGPYDDHWINGYHFIFLETEQGLPKFCDLSSEQLDWLEHQGFYVEVYSDKVLVRGRDFKAGSWIEATHYEVVYPAVSVY